MPGTLARFPPSADNPTGFIGPGGRRFIHLTGKASFLLAKAPMLGVDLSQYGCAGGLAVDLLDVLDALGHVATLTPSFGELLYGEHTYTANRLGAMQQQAAIYSKELY